MRTLSFALGLLAPALLAAAASAQTYTLQLKARPEAGQTVSVHDVSKGVTEIKVTDPDGKVVQELTNVEGREEEYAITGVEKGDKRPKKYRHVYKKAVQTTKGKTGPRSYHGRTVVFEEKDGQYRLSAAGEALAAADLKQLARKANEVEARIKVLLPGKPVKVGETWAITGKALTSVGESAQFEADKSKGQGKLLKVYEKNGKQRGVLQYDLQMGFKPQKGVTFQGPMEFTITLDAAIDGSGLEDKLTTKGKMAARQVVEQGGKKFTVAIKSTNSGTVERTEK